MVSTVFLPRLLRISLELGTHLYQEKGSPHSLRWAHLFFFNWSIELYNAGLVSAVWASFPVLDWMHTPLFWGLSLWFIWPSGMPCSDIKGERLRYFTAAQNEACAASLPTLALEWIRCLWKTCKARGYILGTLLLSCSNYTLGCLSLVDRLSAFRNPSSCTLLFPDWTDLPLTSAPALGSLYKSSQHTRSTHRP